MGPDPDFDQAIRDLNVEVYGDLDDPFYWLACLVLDIGDIGKQIVGGLTLAKRDPASLSDEYTPTGLSDELLWASAVCVDWVAHYLDPGRVEPDPNDTIDKVLVKVAKKDVVCELHPVDDSPERLSLLLLDVAAVNSILRLRNLMGVRNELILLIRRLKEWWISLERHIQSKEAGVGVDG